MANKKFGELVSEAAEDIVSDVVSGDHIALPTKVVAEAVSIGVTAVRKAISKIHIGKRKMGAAEAGTLSDLVGRIGKTGGEAFAAWITSKGIDPLVKRSQEEWDVLLKEFSGKPILGHRRTKNGTHGRK